MKYKLFAIACVCAGFAAHGDIYTPVLDDIAVNSHGIHLLRKQRDEAVLERSLENVLPNPEISTAYAWGNKAVGGDRKNIDVSQSFDFPTLYYKRAQLSRLSSRAGEATYVAAQRDFLLNIRLILDDLIYANANVALSGAMADFYKAHMSLMQKHLAAGNVTAAQYTQFCSEAAAFEADAKRARIEQQRLLTSLKNENGGNPVVFAYTEYPTISLPSDFGNNLDEMSSRNPLLRQLQSEIEVANKNVSVTRADLLPKISVGYTGEFVAGQALNGISLGLEIPIWGNSKKMKYARRQAAAAREALIDGQGDILEQMEATYDELCQLLEIEKTYSEALHLTGDMAFIDNAYQESQITLFEYVQQKASITELRLNLLQTQRDISKAYANLTFGLL